MKNLSAKWSRSKIIKSIKTLFKKEKRITPKDIRLKYYSLYQATFRFHGFNGWRDAVRSAGLLEEYDALVRKKQRWIVLNRKNRKKWSRELIRQEILSLYKKGDSLYAGEIRRKHYNLLRAAANRRYFGSWQAAVEFAGINYRKYLIRKTRVVKVRKISFADASTARLVRKWHCHMKCRNFTVSAINSYLNALAYYERQLSPFRAATFSHNDIRKYLRYCVKKGFAAATVHNRYHGMKKFFEFCLKNKYLKTDPFKYVSPPCLPDRIKEVLSREEVGFFLAWLKRRQNVSEYVKCRDQLLMELIFYCGLRRGELLNLKMSDIDLIEKTLKVVQGKNRKDRLVPLNGNIQETITNYMRLRRPSRIERLLLKNDKTGPIRSNSINVIFKRLRKLSGLKARITPKILRNTFATMLFERGVALRSIQALMGHSNVSTTCSYINVSVNYLRKEMQKHPLLNRDGLCEVF